MRRREIGACLAFCKDNESCYVFDKAEHSRLKADWMAGKAFFDGVGFYGNPLTVKLGAIEAVTLESPEVMALSRDDKAADKHEDDLL